MKNEKIKVMADLYNGIFQVQSFEDYDGCEVLNPADFWECLGELRKNYPPEMEQNSFQNKIIGAELNKKWVKKIADEYGIFSKTIGNPNCWGF